MSRPTTSAFAGQLTADDRHRIGAISRKALRRGRGVSLSDLNIDEINGRVMKPQKPIIKAQNTRKPNAR